MNLLKTDTSHLSRAALVALPALVLLLVLTIFFWWHLLVSGEHLRQATIENGKLRADQVNDALAEAVSMLFFNADEAVQNLTAFYKPGQNAEFGEQARVLTRRFPQGSVLQVAVIGTNGYLEYSNLDTQERVYLGDREHFKVHTGATDQGLFISKPLMGKVSRKWTVQFSRRLERQGRFAGVMVLSLSPDYLFHALNRIAQAPNDVMLILRDSGEIMARNREMDKAVGFKSDKIRIETSAPAGPLSGSYSGQGAIDQVPRIYQWQRLRDYPIIVALGLSMDGLMAPAEQAIRQERIKGLISTVVVWITAILAIVLTLRMQANIRRRVEFEHAALHDSLTGLHNRKALLAHLILQIDKSPGKAARFGLLFIDLDGFKDINDQHGHAAGDTLLQVVAGRLQACARSSDLVTRIGGDEFVIVCHDFVQAQDVMKLVDRIQAALQAPMGIGALQLQVGASIGVALYPEQGQTPDELLIAADRAMYAKKPGRKKNTPPAASG